MINKAYDKITTYIKENFKFLLTLIILFFICTFELPYYIDTPGGLIDIATRVNIDNSQRSEGSLNLAYVTEFRATLPTLLIASINKDWDILKKEEIVANNETLEEIDYRNHLLLEESKDNATIIGFKKANQYYQITNRKVNIVYLYEEADTNLKIGDQIIKINNTKINSKKDVFDIIQNSKKQLEITVLHDNKQHIRYANKINIGSKELLGIILCETKDIDTNNKINFNFHPSESGPSGGFMMALSIYNYLTEEDITNGLKIVGTGTIDEMGNIGSIGGISYKIKAAVKKDADIFFAPSENFKEAQETVLNNQLNIKLIEVKHIDEAIEYLNNL